MNKNLKYKNKIIIEKGFTLIEILTASSIFFLIIMIATGLFIYTSKLQSQSLAHQKLLDETSYVIEYMSRVLRMATKSTDNSCLSKKGLNYEISGSNNDHIKFINSLEKELDDQCQEFYLDFKSATSSSINLKYVNNKIDPSLPLTSENLNITSLRFNLSGVSDSDDLQPFVTMLIEAESKKGNSTTSPKIKIQTSISQRNLDMQSSP